MLSVVKEAKEGILVIRLSGVLDELVDFDALLGPITTQNIHIYCKEITRINSLGARIWMRFFQQASGRGHKIRYFECSPSFVEYLNHIQNFSSGGLVESVAVPFLCLGCRAELIGIMRCIDLVKAKFQLTSLPCSKCGGQSRLDETPGDYFLFLNR